MLRIKAICSILTGYKKHCVILKQKFIEREYLEKILKYQIDKIDNTDRKDLLRKKEKSNADRIPCLVTCNRKLSMMCEIINNYWNILQINLELQETFKNNPLVALKRNKNLQEIIGGHKIKHEKAFKTHLENRNGKSEHCNINVPSL